MTYTIKSVEHLEQICGKPHERAQWRDIDFLK